MEKIDFNDLSPEQQQELMAQAQQKAEEKKKQQEADKVAFKELSAEFVNQNIEKCLNARGLLERVIDELFNDYQKILELKTSVYGDKVKDYNSHTSTLSDGSASITVGWNTVIIFDGTESVGIEMIKEVMASLGGDDERVAVLKEIIDVFLRKNKKTGQLNPAKIIDLNEKRGQINNSQFDEGLDIIINAQTVTRSSMFVSGWKMIEKDGKPVKIEFRFTI